MTIHRSFLCQWRLLLKQKHWLFLSLLIGFFGLTVLTSELNFHDLWGAWQNCVFFLDEHLLKWLKYQSTDNPLFLIPVAFSGGFIASLSPCSLGMLSVNLSYIGTRQIASHQQRFIKVGLFILGVMTTLSLLGLCSSFAGVILIQYRGYLYLIVGTIITLMGLTLLKLFHLPLPQTPFNFPVSGPYTFGLTFALVSSPCTSPVLLGILTTTSVTGSIALSLLLMISYTFGYTAILLLCSVCTGLMQQTRNLLPYSEGISRIGGFILLLMGTYYLINGSRWFLGFAE
jgi:cytochrome c-type biogenesis protein